MKFFFIGLALFIFSTGTAVAQTETEIEDVGGRYKLVLIMSALFILYLISLLSVKMKYISVFNNRRIWNVLLLIVFSITAVMSIMLVLIINFGWFISWYAFLLYWHVEFGSAMIMITIFHLSWHSQYYTAIFKKKPKLEIDNNE
jgi:hypothetical protein